MIRRPPRSTRTDTLFPYTTLFRSAWSERRARHAPHSTRDGLHAFDDRWQARARWCWPGGWRWVVRDRRSRRRPWRSEEHTSELQSLMSSSYAVFCLKNKNTHIIKNNSTITYRSHILHINYIR